MICILIKQGWRWSAWHMLIPIHILRLPNLCVNESLVKAEAQNWTDCSRNHDAVLKVLSQVLSDVLYLEFSRPLTLLLEGWWNTFPSLYVLMPTVSRESYTKRSITRIAACAMHVSSIVIHPFSTHQSACESLRSISAFVWTCASCFVSLGSQWNSKFVMMDEAIFVMFCMSSSSPECFITHDSDTEGSKVCWVPICKFCAVFGTLHGKGFGWILPIVNHRGCTGPRSCCIPYMRSSRGNLGYTSLN